MNSKYSIALHLGLSHESLGKEFAAYQPDVVGITSVTPTIKSTYLTAKIAKQNAPNCVVVLGGPHATFLDKDVLTEEPAVDIVVRGEGEITLAELLSKLFGNGDLGSVLGISFRRNGEIIRTPERPFIENLDDLPYPAYQYFSLKQYRFFGQNHPAHLNQQRLPLPMLILRLVTDGWQRVPRPRPHESG